MSTETAGHLETRILERALTGEANRFDVRAAMRHLVALCPGCASRAAEIAERRGLRPVGETGEASLTVYDASFAKVLGNISATKTQFLEARLRGALQWAELQRLPQTVRWGRVARDAAYHHPGFVAAAGERAEQLGQVAPRAAVAAAELAVLAAERLAAAGRPSPAFAADLEAAALGALGEARRRAGSLERAQEALQAARQRLAAGTGEPLAAGEQLRREARLAVELAETGEALRSLERARETYAEVEDWPAVGHVLLAIARVIAPQDLPEALKRTDDALFLIDPANDPRADLRGFLQLGWFLVDAGRPEEARALLAVPQADPDGRCGGEPERLLRLWLTARVARALGRPAEAAPAFAAVVAGWRAFGRLRPRAFATLDLVEALQATDQIPDAVAAVRALAKALDRWGFHDQGQVFVEELAPALAGGRAADDICSTLTVYLQRAWHRPLPFPALDALDDAPAAAAH